MKRSASRRSSGEDRRRQAPRHRVVQRRSPRRVAVAHHVEDRREGLAQHRARLPAAHQRRAHVVAASGRPTPRAAAMHRAARGWPRPAPPACRRPPRVDQRADQRAGSQRVADRHGVGRCRARQQRRRRFRARTAGAAWCSAGRRCPWRRRRSRAAPGRGRRSARRWPALLPPSSRRRGRSAARRGPTARPMRRRAGGRHQRHAGSSTSASPMAAAPISTGSDRPARRVAEAGHRAREQRLAGQRGERRLLRRLPDTGSPHTSASAAFHAHTATGKLKAEMTPTTPSGCQVSIMRWPGRSVAMVRP
jgi:hypothetical protein